MRFFARMLGSNVELPRTGTSDAWLCQESARLAISGSAYQ